MICPTCKTPLADNAPLCTRCGAAFPAGPIPQRTTRPSGPGPGPGPMMGVWVEGKDLIIRKTRAQLPPSCVKCGRPAEHRIPAKLYWHHPGLYVLVLVNLFVYAIVAMIVRKQIAIEVPICDEHRRRRRQYRWLAVAAGLGACVVLAALMAANQPGLGGLLCMLLWIVCVLLLVQTRLLVPRFIDPEIAKVRGAADAFLAQIPPA